MGKIKIVLGDTEPIFTEGFVAVVKRTPDIDVVATCDTGFETIRKCVEFKPDLLLLDKYIQDCDFVQVCKNIRSYLPSIKIVITQQNQDPTPLSAVVVEADSYIAKGIPIDVMFQMFRQIKAGDSYLSPMIARKFLDEFYRGMKNIRISSKESEIALTDREIEVLTLIVDKCYSNRDISKVLCIAEGTVKSHLSRIMQKLHVRNRVEAALWIKERGIKPSSNKSPAYRP